MEMGFSRPLPAAVLAAPTQPLPRLGKGSGLAGGARAGITAPKHPDTSRAAGKANGGRRELSGSPRPRVAAAPSPAPLCWGSSHLPSLSPGAVVLLTGPWGTRAWIGLEPRGAK